MTTANIILLVLLVIAIGIIIYQMTQSKKQLRKKDKVINYKVDRISELKEHLSTKKETLKKTQESTRMTVSDYFALASLFNMFLLNWNTLAKVEVKYDNGNAKPLKLNPSDTSYDGYRVVEIVKSFKEKEVQLTFAIPAYFQVKYNTPIKTEVNDLGRLLTLIEKERKPIQLAMNTLEKL